MSKRTVADWRREVYRSPRITDKTRVYLLLLADHMNADRTVSVPRLTVAKLLGKSVRRIDDRTKEAKDAGLLDTVVRGQKHVTAVYVGLFPDKNLSAPESSGLSGVSAPESSGLSGVKIQRPETRLSAPPGERATSKRPTADTRHTPPRIVAPTGADADAPRREVGKINPEDLGRAPTGVPSRSEANKRAATRELWRRYAALIAESNSDAQVEVASCFVALVGSSDLRSPAGFLERILRDHEHIDAREVGSVLAYRLFELAERHSAPVVWLGEEWQTCSSCWAWRFACGCPVADVWPAVESVFGGVAADVLNELAFAVDAAVRAEGAARVLRELPPAQVVDSIRRDGNEEKAAQRLTSRLRRALVADDGWDAPAAPHEERAEVDQ